MKTHYIGMIIFFWCNMTIIAQMLPTPSESITFDGVYNFLRPGFYYMLAHPVNIRSEPNLNASVIGQLGLHERIEIAGSAFSIMNINGIWADWYRIRHGNDFGYIWAAILSYYST